MHCDTLGELAMNSPAIQFEIHPSSGVPIYRQLMDQLRALIASGRLQPGDLVPSVRQLGDALSVNMMTVSKAYAKLEAEGVLERDRGVGMRVKVTAATGSVADRQRELVPFAEQLVTRGWQLQLSNEQVLEVVHEAQKKK
ncbi:MAG TPA: GntR family transcriptional regulator [Planctomycetaceae bacterium]|nr:GntR family transcriptional regulator [Planctomycetaceae bacterium]